MKIRALSVALVLSVFFAGCSPFALFTLVDYNELVDARFQTIAEAAAQDNAEAILELFSQNFRDNNPDAIKKAEEFADYFRGTVVSVGEPTHNERMSTNSNGVAGNVREIRASCRIETTQSAYWIEFREYVAYTSDPTKIGLHSLYIIEADDFPYDNGVYCWLGYKTEPGIEIFYHWPEEEETD